MRIGASLILIAAGAILRWGVQLHTGIGSTRVNWNVVADVLMVVGVIGLVISLIWIASVNRRGRADYPADYRAEGPYAP
jgi:hypothetical protein